MAPFLEEAIKGDVYLDEEIGCESLLTIAVLSYTTLHPIRLFCILLTTSRDAIMTRDPTQYCALEDEQNY
eukprot:scaffold735_cov116-Cylindrotheca_fusiformis.AAC.3